MSVYLDASVLLPLLVAEPSSRSIQDFLRALDERPIVSDFAAAEVASAISRLVRASRITLAFGRAVLDDFDAWRAGAAAEAETEAADVRLATAHVRRFELMLRAPDALHIAMSQRLGVRLATLDQKMARAATVLGVKLALSA